MRNTYVTTPGFEPAPEDYLASLSASRGNLRRFLEEHALPPVGDAEQRTAGLAAVAEAFGLDVDEFAAGIETVSGSEEAAGGPPVHNGERVEAAAFFDVDNTLIQGASIIVFMMGLARRRYFKASEVIPMAWKQFKFRVTGTENAHDVAHGRQQALEFIQGRSVDELVTLCEEIVDDRMVEKIWPGTRKLAEMHLAEGEQVWLVTATPVQLAHILARKLGFTGALGTVAEAKDGVFTGRLVGDILHGPGKRHAVAALAAVEGLDLSRCTAYSDSINDIPMLTMVGTAVAINPDSKLRREATRRGWHIQDYRNIRKAIRTYGLPTLVAASLSYRRWRGRGRSK